MKGGVKESALLVAFGVCLFVALSNLSMVLGFLARIIQLLLPIINGLILAIFINVPVVGIRRRLDRLFGRMKKPLSRKLVHGISVGVALVFILLVLALVLVLFLPKLIRSVQSIYEKTKVNIPQWLVFLKTHDLNATWLEAFLASLNMDTVMQTISDSMNKVFAHTKSILSSTLDISMTAIFATIVCVYALLGKERLCRHAHKMVCAYLEPKWAGRILRFTTMFSTSFSSFLTGQCAEAVILGTLMGVAFTIFKVPYASIIAVLTAVCAIIPYAGAFISGSVSVILTLLVDPAAVLRCLVVYSVVQFIENQFIYPRVVGGAVGLPPLYTLFAAMVGGKLFGVLGIIFFIPLAAVTIALIKEDVAIRLEGPMRGEVQ